jgi:ribosomal protein S18 acetylase RimI-like enzyme
MQISFQPALDYDFANLAVLFNRSFEGYFVPMKLSAATLAEICRTESTDLSSSPIVYLGGLPVGLMLIARRGYTSRIQGMGIVLEERGHRIGRKLLEHGLQQAKERGDKTVLLEVIEKNTAAKALYKSVGFKELRRLVGFERPAIFQAASADKLENIDPLEFASILRLETTERLPWQISPESLGNCTAPWKAVALEDKAFALYSIREGRGFLRGFFVRRSARRQGWGSRLLRALPNLPWSINPIVPEGLLDGFLEQNGFKHSELLQLEMQFRLD